ncbi:hypothetical protein [Glycomyces albidus]|jgi:hypothetical protein|uniref:Uncharacterized protein n=1 Tax=Glycomyces albidus TaxID=2656774 RepID=A0A6L5G8E1_9ACTN|nr:hypothetical protein [Glycomyces albidus]MQM25886.1 hypothetical protein [Glycomyces albidus]
MEPRKDVRVVFTGDNVLYLQGLDPDEVARLQQDLGGGITYRHLRGTEDDREVVIFPGNVAYIEVTTANR